jgi:prepilin-type N-terminal cleavage/methylation domain-containing protein
MLQQKHLKKGFTIIEVVLVLAIAGLIFLMVFLALPALQRAQRDTQRKEDISRFMTAVTHYEANNRGAIPDLSDGSRIASGEDGAGNSKNNLNPSNAILESVPAAGSTPAHDKGSATYTGCNVNPNGAPTAPNSFCGRYLIVQGANDQFADPDGTPYVIHAANDYPADNVSSTFDAATIANGGLGRLTTASAGNQEGVTILNECRTTCAAIEINGNGGDSTDHGGYSAYAYIIHVIYSATCNGEVAIKSSGARKFAVLYKLEGGGVMCQSN